MLTTTDIETARRRLATLYSADVFQKAGQSWVRALAEHFTRLQTQESAVLNWCPPKANVDDASGDLGRTTHACDDLETWLPEFNHLLHKALSKGQNLHHRRYIGHQVPASVPLAALFDALGSVTNQVMAIYEMGPWATAVERAVISRLGAEIGYPPESFGGIMTNGGSLANLTALLTARNVTIQDAWTTGIDLQQRPVLVVQQDVHYCVVRAAGVLGIGTDNVIRIPVDSRRKMRVDELDKTLLRLRSEHRPIVAVAAGACATPIGAFDPLAQVADVCERHQVWLHVDAAHGGAALMSDRHRHLLDGLERADSIVWDAHKMLFMPALSAFAFYKDRQHRFAAFQQDAPYLFDPTNPGIAEYDSGTQTVECTKRALALPLWGMWSLFGRQLFADLVDVTFDTARRFYEKLEAADDFEPLHEPECNIQVFRYLPAAVRGWPAHQLSEFQLELRRDVITSGAAYIVPSRLDGVGALRSTVINPLTQDADLDQVLEAIRDCGRRLLRSDRS